jgi:hypothetical protein
MPPAISLGSKRRRVSSGLQGVRSTLSVGEGNRIAEQPDTLDVGGVAYHPIQAMVDDDGGDHRIGDAAGLARTLKVGRDLASQLACRLVKNRQVMETPSFSLCSDSPLYPNYDRPPDGCKQKMPGERAEWQSAWSAR